MSEKIINKCNFCRFAEELNTENISFWSKKSANYKFSQKLN